jgi:LacI family transcriptional regulator
MAKTMGITIKDVALRVGVTPATVSMVINNKPRISDATRRKVLEAIEELDYFPHEGARSLVLKRTNTLGVAAPFFTSYFVLETLSGIEQELRQSDFNLVLYGTRGLLKTEDEVITKIARERKVDGLITVNLSLTPKQLKYFQKNNLAIVSLESDLEGCDSVQVDNAHGAYVATKHLLELGHKRIALVNGSVRFSSAKQREDGFLKAMAEAKVALDPELSIQVANYRREEGFDAGNQLLQLRQPPTAIFVAAGDVCATGVLLALKRNGIDVPKQMSVVGFDDQPFTELVEPPLTTVRQPMAKMGAEAFHLLKQAIQSTEPRQPKKLVYETELIVRHSTAEAPGHRQNS